MDCRLIQLFHSFMEEMLQKVRIWRRKSSLYVYWSLVLPTWLCRVSGPEVDLCHCVKQLGSLWDAVSSQPWASEQTLIDEQGMTTEVGTLWGQWSAALAVSCQILTTAATSWSQTLILTNNGRYKMQLWQSACCSATDWETIHQVFELNASRCFPQCYSAIENLTRWCWKSMAKLEINFL